MVKLTLKQNSIDPETYEIKRVLFFYKSFPSIPLLDATVLKGDSNSTRISNSATLKIYRNDILPIAIIVLFMFEMKAKQRSKSNSTTFETQDIIPHLDGPKSHNFSNVLFLAAKTSSF